MSNILKLIIPLLDSEITLDDISPETGFVDAYTNDKNRPSLDNHIFLLYKWEPMTVKGVHVYYKFRKLRSLWGSKIIYINGEAMIVYTFLSNKLINSLQEGAYSVLSNISKSRILQFWRFTDRWVDRNILSGIMDISTDTSSVPEVDYLGDDEETKMGEAYGLVCPTH